MFFAPVSHYVVPTTMLDVLKHLGLGPNLKLCLDAGDSASYDGSSQTWTDVAGDGNNFYRGSGSGSDSSDPTFNGTAGRQSSGEYFSFDGGDAFWQTASHSFMNGWHKDGATFTVLWWGFMPTGAATSMTPLRNIRDTDDIGVAVVVSRLSSVGHVYVSMFNGSVQQDFDPPTEDAYSENTWTFFGLSFSEGSGTSFVAHNGTIELLSSDSYTSPSASNPGQGISLFGSPDVAGTALDTPIAGVVPSSGSRINSILAWNSALSQAQVTAVYNATKAKFGL